MNQIFIREMRADAWVGVYDWEQLRPQTLEFDIDFGVATEKAGASDKLKDTIDYGAVVNRVRAELKDRRFKLLEALAEDLAQILLSEFGAPWVRISVAKLNHVRGVKKLGVVITRAQPGQSAPGSDD
jgi:7,8-dihydroneopterin aldolase/epimerase/oxygenase